MAARSLDVLRYTKGRWKMVRQPWLVGKPSSALGSFYKGTFARARPRSHSALSFFCGLRSQLGSTLKFFFSEAISFVPTHGTCVTSVTVGTVQGAGCMHCSLTCPCRHSPNVLIKIPSPLLKSSTANKDLCGSIHLSEYTLNLHAHLLLRHPKGKY